ENTTTKPKAMLNSVF
ncbi:unnamed protein product, partial [Rotaria magnacalcarata]